MAKYKHLTKDEWRTYGEKVSQMKRILRELMNIQIPLKLREAPLLKVQKHLNQLCGNLENEMLRQHPDMEDALSVFFGDRHLRDSK